MPLSEEPNLGIWTIRSVENNKDKIETVNFEVKKYVLPKFEVTLDHYNKLKFDEKTLNITVCAKYTYGKSVIGKFDINVYTKKFSYETYTELVKKSVHLTKKNAKGCHTFEVATSEIGVELYTYNIYVDSSVTESDTSIRIHYYFNHQLNY